METFDLLRLPLLAICNCLEFMDIFEVLDLSLTSKRAFKLVQCINWTIIDTQVFFSKDSKIMIQLSNYPGQKWVFDFEEDFDIHEEGLITRKIGPISYPTQRVIDVKGEKTFFHMFFPYDNQNQNIRLIIEYLSQIFRTPVRCVSIEELDDAETLSILQWLATIQPSIQSLDLDTEMVSDCTGLFVLESLKVTNDVSLNAKLTKSLGYSQPIDVRALHIGEMDWVTFECILNGRNEIVTVAESSLEPSDLNFILKAWLNRESFENLEYLEVCRYNLRSDDGRVEDPGEVFNEITKDIEFKEHIRNEKRPMQVVDRKEVSITVEQDGCFDIVREGKIGTFSHNYSVEREKNPRVFHHFTLHVWKTD